MLRYILIVGILLLKTSYLFSQDNGGPTIIFDIKNGVISDTEKSQIPFDESFKIVGALSEMKADILKVKLKIAKHCMDITDENSNCQYEYSEKWHYYFYNKVDSDGFKILPDEDISSKTNFEIDIPPLHPNERYIIHFNFLSRLGKKEGEIDQVKEEMIKFVNEMLSFNKPLKEELPIIINKNIKEILFKETGKTEFYLKNGDPADLNSVLSQNAKDILKELAKENNKIYKLYADLNFSEPEDTKEIINLKLNEILGSDFFLEGLKKVKNNKKLWAQLSKKNLNYGNLKASELLETLLLDFNKYSYDQIYFTGNDYYEIPILLRNDNRILEVLTGQKKISGNTIDDTENIDIQSGEAIFEAISFILNSSDENGAPYFSDETVKTINKNEEKWIKKVQEINQIRKNIIVISKSFPNLLADLYSSKLYVLNLNTIVKIDTKEIPYIGVDFGVLIAPEISSTFLLDGLNFHILPVNRSASYKDLQGLDELLKRFSFQIGLVQRIGSYENDRYEKFFDLGSPYFGTGFRATRWLRLNLGGFYYKEKNPNPLITQTETAFSWGVSASLDVKLKDAFTFIGKFYNP